jgi:outer membrane protein assembly factor BamE (lipoprotein component of BamABCDE complex)
VSNDHSPNRRALRRIRPLILRPALAVAVALLAGCATIDKYAPTLTSFGVYKLDINQGNYLSQDMVA